jgi:NADPH2:quinone reductase
MKALVLTDFGGPDLFEMRDLPVPEPGPTDILVKVMATALNPVDYKVRRSGRWVGLTFPAVLGYDVAGIVEKAGVGVKRFKPGDRVFYSPVIHGSHGTYAEYHVVDESIVAFMPVNLSFEEAAGLPLAGCTAWDCITFMNIIPGQTVLIHAAAGGVGSLAVQMAKAFGATVMGTCSGKNMDFVKSLGADHVIDYREEDFADRTLALTGDRGADSILDTVGGETLERSFRALKPYGRLANIVNPTGNFRAAYHRNPIVYFCYMRRSFEKIEQIRVMAEKGLLRPVIDSVITLDEVPAAHTRLEKGGVRGKIIVRVGD